MDPSEASGRHRPRRRAVDSLLVDPPLIDRLLWREGIEPRTLISEDRGLMARTYGTIAALGALLGFAVTLAGPEADGDRPLMLAISAAALLLAVISFVGYRRLPWWFFHLAMIAGTAMISVAGARSSGDAAAAYPFYYVWIVFVAFVFFRPTAAAAHATLAGGAFAVIQVARESPYEINLLVSALATFGATGALVGILRARIEGMTTVLARQVETDPVTALTNRRGFDARFQSAAERAARLGRPLALIICDLDRFKAVNDALGHQEGDRTLCRAAAAIEEAIRTSDFVARLGGEEFGVVLPDAGVAAGFAVAERIRHGIMAEFASFAVPVTVSCGVGVLGPEGDPAALFRAADGALYDAKRHGRNRSVVATTARGVIPLRQPTAV